jgi:sporulation protein YlmC with PRC-barrel domain
MKSIRPCIVLTLASILLATGAFAASRSKADKGDESTIAIYRASTLMGTRVENLQGKHLGEVEDIVIDPEDGIVAYAVLSFGGVLGLGETYFPVPWKSLQDKPGAEKTLLLDITKEQLKNAPHFNKAQWSSLADRRWGADIHTYYAQQVYWERLEEAQQEVKETAMSPRPRPAVPVSRAELIATTVSSADGVVKLRTTDGQTVQLRTSGGFLDDLKAGEQVEIAIQPRGAPLPGISDTSSAPPQPGVRYTAPPPAPDSN